MLLNLLLIVLMIRGAFAAPRKVGIDFNAASSQVSEVTANKTLPASSTVSATRDLNTTTSGSPGSVFSSLTSIFPISLPPDTLNSTLLPPPPTSLPSSKTLPLSVSASTSTNSAPTAISSPVLSTISVAAPSTSAPAATSSSAPTAVSSSAPAAASSAAASTAPAATSSKSGPVTSTTRTSISILTISKNETRTFCGTHSRNRSHTNLPFTSPGGSRPTTLQTSTKINRSSISSASSSHVTGGPCLKDTDRWCPPNMNNPQGSDGSSGINQPPSNDFRVDITVNGGSFKGGKPFNSSETYHGNCTNGILDTVMASMDVHEPCGRDLMCLVGVLMASLGSVVTEIMNPTPKGTVSIWCSNVTGDANSSIKTSGNRSGIPWSTSETGKWDTSMTSGKMITTPGALSNNRIQPTGTPGVPESPPTTLNPLPSSLSPAVTSTSIPTDTGSMFRDTALPRTTSSENATFSSNISLLPSVLSSDTTFIAATVSQKPTSDSSQDGWSEWRTARLVPNVTQRSIVTTIQEAADFSTDLGELGSLLSSGYSAYMKTSVTVIPRPTIAQRAATSLDAFDSMTSAHPLNLTALSELSAWLETFGLTQRAVPTKTESMNSGFMPGITQRQLITTTVSNSYTTATYDYWELSPFTWSVNSVQVSEALTLLSTRTPIPTNTA